MRKSKRENEKFFTSAILNNQTFIDYLQRFKQVATSMFEWINLPSSMNAEYLEECLYLFGMASLLKTQNYGFINTKCCSNGNLNIYKLPSSLNCYSFSFNESRKLYTGFINDEDEEYKTAVLVKNNFEMLPTEPSMMLFAYRLYECERTCDVNIKAQKTPTILTGDETAKLFLQNLYLKYEGNEPVIFGDKKQLGENAIRCIKTEAPFVADKIMEYKKNIWNEALTYLGINNLTMEKKERMISEEASSNNELINLNLQARLTCRKNACKQFNELFKLPEDKKIDVRVRSDLHNVIKNNDSIVNDFDKKEGDELE